MDACETKRHGLDTKADVCAHAYADVSVLSGVWHVDMTGTVHSVSRLTC